MNQCKDLFLNSSHPVSMARQRIQGNEHDFAILRDERLFTEQEEGKSSGTKSVPSG